MTVTTCDAGNAAVKLDDGATAELGEDMFSIPAVLVASDRPTFLLSDVSDPAVLLDLDELRELRAAARAGRRPKATVPMSTGSAHYMGDDQWYVTEYDETAHAWYETMITCGDVDRMLAAAA